ncbi:glycosyltransferase family 4 protein [Nisaea nitritireducens]|uniref:glycosyltransferase family 4 protein n=1 Tax=Nisaea nitritireducens TaxID=568392 RepID=UPI001868759C|nr:glycosyltransferase family 4 protein [Nisaea nitritireducens]
MPRCSVALLLNIVPPYRVALLQALEREVRRLTVLVSTGMEADRSWKTDWRGLDVRVSRSLTLPYRRRHPDGFGEDLSTHLSIDMLPRLCALAPDIVISSEFGARTLQACLYRCLAPLLGRRTRLLVWATLSEHSERGRGWARSALRRVMAKFSDGAMTNGASGASYLESIGFAPERIFRIHQSTDLDRFADLDTTTRPAADDDERPFRLVTVGSLIQRKGLRPFLLHLIAWCEAHPDRALDWRLIGDGPERAALEALVLPANLRLTLLGDVAYEDVPALMADADLLAFPTLADEWGLVVNEAMATGLPVLASCRAQAAEEMVTDGEDGWLFDPADPAATDATLSRALDTPADARIAMGEAARLKAARFSHANTVRRIMQAIETVWDT